METKINPTLNIARPKAPEGDSKFLIRFTHCSFLVFSLVQISMLFTAPVVHIYLSPDEASLVNLNSFGTKSGNSTYSNMIASNSGISIYVAVGAILLFVFLIISTIYLDVILEYICLAVSLILFGLCLINISLIDAVTIQGTSVNFVKMEVWTGFVIPFLSLVLISHIVTAIVRLKKLQKAQSSNDGN